MKNAFMVWNDFFIAGELNAFEEYGDRMVHEKAALAVKGDNDDDIRITEIARLEHNRETSGLYERVLQVIRRTRGAIIAFPSFFPHRVTPIISGTRKALVVWATGPEFR
jgi:hypothetical protein